jgi:hypothetical protein
VVKVAQGFNLARPHWIDSSDRVKSVYVYAGKLKASFLTRGGAAVLRPYASKMNLMAKATRTIDGLHYRGNLGSGGGVKKAPNRGLFV